MIAHILHYMYDTTGWGSLPQKIASKQIIISEKNLDKKGVFLVEQSSYFLLSDL